MDEIVSFLNRIPAWFLATIDEHDPSQPRVRPFSFAMADADKLWFCTSRDKDVWRELTARPKFEASGWKPGECWIVLSGVANIADDAHVSEAVREAGYKHMVGLGEAHESAHDGRLAFFTVEHGKARFCEIDGSERVVELSGSNPGAR